MLLEWNTIHIIMFVCNLIVSICFFLIPVALHTLAHMKRIGYSLNGWFSAISAVFLCCSGFMALDAFALINPNLMQYQAVVTLILAGASVFSTGFLFWRERMLIKHPELLERNLERFLREVRESREAASDAYHTRGSNRAANSSRGKYDLGTQDLDEAG